MRHGIAFAVVMAFVAVTSVGIPIARRDLAAMIADVPVILTGVVVSVKPYESKGDVFGLEREFDRKDAYTARAVVKVDSVMKGVARGSTVEVLFFRCFDGSPFTNLREGLTYVLFLSQSEHGLRLYDPANGALQIERGVMAGVSDSTPEEQLKSVVHKCLTSTNASVVFTALLATSELRDTNSIPAVGALVACKDDSVRLAALSTLVRLGEWEWAGEAAKGNDRMEGKEEARSKTDFWSLSLQGNLTSSLAGIADRKAVPIIVELLKSELGSPTKELLLRSLERISDQRSVGILLELLQANDLALSYRAYVALCKIKGSGSIMSRAKFETNKAAVIEEMTRWVDSLGPVTGEEKGAYKVTPVKKSSSAP